jgi:hypothetical protein
VVRLVDPPHRARAQTVEDHVAADHQALRLRLQ